MNIIPKNTMLYNSINTIIRPSNQLNQPIQPTQHSQHSKINQMINTNETPTLKKTKENSTQTQEKPQIDLKTQSTQTRAMKKYKDIKKSEIIINTEKEMERYIGKCKYMVVFPDKTMLFYSNLRDIAQEIFIPHCTISKRLREDAKQNPNKKLPGCICESHTSGNIYYIIKL